MSIFPGDENCWDAPFKVSGTAKILSGDQALWWDAPLKLKVLQSRGIQVTHEIHSVDQFSRSAVPVTSPRVVREYALPHNQRSFWSSSMKTSLFLGRVLVSQEEVEPYVGLKGLTQGLGANAEKVSEEFFSTDTFGVVVPNGERIIQGVGFRELQDRFKHLRGLIHRNLKEALVDSNINLDVWNNLFGITRYIPAGAGLDVSIGRLWENALKNFVGAGEGSGIEITTSFDNFPRFINIATGLLAIFRKDYGRLAELYNRAATTIGMAKLDVDKQELPYFFVDRGRWGQDWVRQTIFLSDVTKLSADAVIIPKAIPILIEILMRGPTVMPEHGSVYSSASDQFLEDLRGIGHNFVCHRVWRVRFSALDRLADTNIKFRLPEYLRGYFGTEIISGTEFAQEWRSVADRSRETLEGLKAARGNLLYDLLVKDGCLNEETVGRLLFLKEKLVSSSARCQMADLDIINAEVKCLETRILARKLRRVIELIQVSKGLEYWNSRPYYWWVALMDPAGAWERCLIEKAVIYHEELQ